MYVNNIINYYAKIIRFYNMTKFIFILVVKMMGVE